MLRKVVDVVMFAVVLVGGVFAWRSGTERKRLEGEVARLVRVAGDLTIVDPSKIHVQAIETGKPLHFAWRVYIPPNAQVWIRDNIGGLSSVSGGPKEFIARVILRNPPEGGMLQGFREFDLSNSRLSMGSPELADFLRGHEPELRVEQLGVGKVAVIAKNEPAVLLRLAWPESMKAKIAGTLPPLDQYHFAENLLLIRPGPEKPASPKLPTGK